MQIDSSAKQEDQIETEVTSNVCGITSPKLAKKIAFTLWLNLILCVFLVHLALISTKPVNNMFNSEWMRMSMTCMQKCLVYPQYIHVSTRSDYKNKIRHDIFCLFKLAVWEITVGHVDICNVLVKCDLKVGCERVDSMLLTNDRVRWLAFVDTAMNLRVR